MHSIPVPSMGAVLLQLHPDDAEAIAAFVCNNFSAITQYIEWHNYTNPIEIRSDLLRDFDDPLRYFFGVYHQGNLSGLIRLVPQSSKNYWKLVYAKDANGQKGLMTEAVKAVTEWLKEQYPQSTIQAEVAHDNIQSRALLERAGFIPLRENTKSIHYQLSS